MSTQIGDLWPAELVETTVQTPASILREQAAVLARRTDSLIDGEVATISWEGRLVHTFILVAPALDGYRYELFRISHPITLYPVKVEQDPRPFPTGILDRLNRAVDLNSEQEFVAWLKSVLNSEETKRVISSLLTQSKGLAKTRS